MFKEIRYIPELFKKPNVATNPMLMFLKERLAPASLSVEHERKLRGGLTSENAFERLVSAFALSRLFDSMKPVMDVDYLGTLNHATSAPYSIKALEQ